MSFTSSKTGKFFPAGWFLADPENCLRETKTIAANHAAVVTEADGTKYVPAGVPVPANGSTAVGILYEPIDVTAGAAPGSVVTEGVVIEDKLPVTLETAAKTAMARIKFVTASPTVTRPY